MEAGEEEKVPAMVVSPNSFFFRDCHPELARLRAREGPYDTHAAAWKWTGRPLLHSADACPECVRGDSSAS